MALRTLAPMAEVHDRISLRVREMSSPARAGVRGTSSRGSAALGLAAPHPMFNLDLDAIDRPDWSDRVQMTGWRYFVTSNAGVIAAAEASSQSAGGSVHGTATNEGPFVIGSEQALELTEKHPEIARGSYVLGLIRVPVLYVIALWLRSEESPNTLDRFVPVAPAPTPFVANRLMNPAQFVNVLRELKARRALTRGVSDEASN